MKNEKKVVLGLYRTRAELEVAVSELKENGFRNSDISALFPSGDETKSFAHEKATKAPEGATTGAVTGVAVGGVLGWLAGIGTLAIPGVGPLIAAGPIMATLAGVGVGATVGSVAGALIGMGIPEYEAKRYEGRIKDGGILLSVHCDNETWEDKAKDILEVTHAKDISGSTEAGSPSSASPTDNRRSTISGL